jgi:hypothetical protein
LALANKSKSIGTKAESIVVEVAKRNGFPFARRSTLSGALDKGDVHLGDGTSTIIEVKGGKQCVSLTPAKMHKWMKETRAEIANSGSDYGFLVTQRAGYGIAKAESWFAHVPAELVNDEYVADGVDYITCELVVILGILREKLDG